MKRRRFGKWAPSVGELITGRIIYFDNPDGSFIAVIRCKDRYWLLPREARDLFLDGRPRDGSVVTIERKADGYCFHSAVSPEHPAYASVPLEVTANDDL